MAAKVLRLAWPMVGQIISHYRVIEKLGEGGMGVVHKALDTRLDRVVALKVLPPEKVADADRKQRFVLEAKAASALNHPNIITIHDIDSANGIDFIAMEFVAGKTFDRLIPRHGLRLNEALKYSVQIADALAALGSGGTVTTSLGSNPAAISSLVLQSDGKIVAAGSIFTVDNAGFHSQSAVARYLGQ
jgi:serine/threonine protein kinase